MKFASLVEVVAAMHLTPRVASAHVSNERGGLMIVAPPGQLKTTAIEYLDLFPRTRLISNITVHSLNQQRQDFLSGEVLTLAFPDYDMIYKRHDTVSAQVEGTLMALMGEGFRNPAFSDQRTNVTKARVTVISGITIKCYEEYISQWIDSGFARRFLWCRYWLSNPEVLEQAIARWRRHHLSHDFVMKIPPPENLIPRTVTNGQADNVLYQLRHQPDRKLPQVTANRIISVLCWKHGKQKGWNIWNDFATSLDKNGTEILL